MEWVIAIGVIFLLFKLTGGSRSTWQKRPEYSEPPTDPPVPPHHK